MKYSIIFISAFLLLSACSQENTDNNESAANSLGTSISSLNLPKEESELIAKLNSLPPIPESLIGTREGESYISKFMDLKDNWQTQNSQPNKIGISEIKNWVCIVKVHQIPNIGDNQASCTLPGMTMEKLMNGTGSDGLLTVRLIEPISEKIYKDDKILISGYVDMILMNTIVNSSVYQVQIHLQNGSYVVKK